MSCDALPILVFHLHPYGSPTQVDFEGLPVCCASGIGDSGHHRRRAVGHDLNVFESALIVCSIAAKVSALPATAPPASVLTNVAARRGATGAGFPILFA